MGAFVGSAMDDGHWPMASTIKKLITATFAPCADWTLELLTEKELGPPEDDGWTFIWNCELPASVGCVELLWNEKAPTVTVSLAGGVAGWYCPT